jgi:hypothetical protein
MFMPRSSSLWLGTTTWEKEHIIAHGCLFNKKKGKKTHFDFFPQSKKRKKEVSMTTTNLEN